MLRMQTASLWRGAAAAMVLAAAVCGAAPVRAQTPAPAGTIRVGLIGLDTSHAVAFTELLNDPARPDHVPGARVVAAVAGGSPDVEASATRVGKFTAELRDTWKIAIVGSIADLIPRVDAIMLTSVDGRVHLAQIRPALAARKPVFVDKPLAASVRDAIEIARLAREHGTPIFSSSSLRFTEEVQGVKKDPKVQQVHGAVAWGPGTLEPHHPDLFWYGIHAVEILYTFMGPGCAQVTRTYSPGADVVTCQWRDGRTGGVRTIRDGAAPYGQVVFGAKGVVSTPAPGTVSSTVKRSSYFGLVTAIIEFFRTGVAPVPVEETLEIMAFMEAADLSKMRKGAPVDIAEVLPRSR
jgi:predicted dehydrogenase